MVSVDDNVNNGPMLGLYCPLLEDEADAAAIRAKYGFPRLEREPTLGYALVWSGARLQLHAYGKNAPGPVVVDWSEPKAKRRLQTGGRQQPLARACGFKPKINPRIVDATAGLGQDAFVLAWLGAEVQCFERSPIACALLEDGLRRAAGLAAVAEAAARIRLNGGDSLRLLSNIQEFDRPDAVYLDPMYPHTGRTALSGKNMQAFQLCIGEDLDADALLDEALNIARQRVVVKRPKKGAFMAGRAPSFQILGESTRYDIYLAPASFG